MKVCALFSMVLIIVSAAAVPTGVNAAFPYVGLYGDTLGGLGGACHSRCDVFLHAPFTVIEYWIWFKPDPAKGMTAGEFQILYPPASYAVPMDVTVNPLIRVELGSLNAGMSFSLGEQNCQYDWFWSHWQQMFVFSPVRSLVVRVAPHPATGHIWAGSCEPGFPIYDVNILNHFVINQSCYCALGNPLLCAEMMGLQGIDGVEYTSFTSLDVSFGYPNVHDCTVAPYEDNFLLRSTSVPPETIAVTQAARTGIGLYRLTLATPMVDGTSYILEARNICSCEGCSPACESSSWQFVFDASVGVHESSWGAIKNLYKK